MYDSVIGDCPHCGKQVELQSKAGDCSLDRYEVEEVPVDIAKDLALNDTPWNTTCWACKKEYKFKCYPSDDDKVRLGMLVKKRNLEE